MWGLVYVWVGVCVGGCNMYVWVGVCVGGCMWGGWMGVCVGGCMCGWVYVWVGVQYQS